MKKNYMGLKAEKIDFGSFNMATTCSGPMPPSCIQIVADLVDAGSNVCKNQPSTIQYMWFGDSPYWCEDD